MREGKWTRGTRTGSGIREETVQDALMNKLGLDDQQRSTFLALNDGGYLAPVGDWDIPLSIAIFPDVPVGIYLDSIMIVPSREDEYGLVRAAYNCARDMFALARIDVAKIGTHLDRVQKKDAIGLLALGYLNAFFWTIELKPVEAKETEILKKMPERLKYMVKST